MGACSIPSLRRANKNRRCKSAPEPGACSTRRRARELVALTATSTVGDTGSTSLYVHRRGVLRALCSQRRAGEILLRDRYQYLTSTPQSWRLGTGDFPSILQDASASKGETKKTKCVLLCVSVHPARPVRLQWAWSRESNSAGQR